MTDAGSLLAGAFEAHRRALWDLCYRMTGSAADADDLVQETFARAVASPPPQLDEPLHPWLFRIAVNLARDLLRRRKRQPYPGPWLPSPVETGDAAEPEAPAPSPEARYGLLESASFAFLLAVEALTPKQRAVLLLRDVFDYSLKDAATVLRMSEGAVAVAHHRARAAMAAYDRSRCVPTRALQERTRRALESFLGAVMTGDVTAAEALLVQDAYSLSDTGGEALAAIKPIDGAWRVARYFIGINRKSPPVGGLFEIRTMNGLPALLVRLPEKAGSRTAKKMVLTCELDPATDRIRAIHFVGAARKLSAIQFPAL